MVSAFQKQSEKLNFFSFQDGGSQIWWPFVSTLLDVYFERILVLVKNRWWLV